MQTYFKVSRLNGGFSIEKEIKMNVVADFNQVLGRFSLRFFPLDDA